MKQDVYAVDRRIDNVVNRLQESQLSGNNVDLLQSFYRDALTGAFPGRSLKKITVQGNLECFQLLDHVIDFELDQASRDELKELVATINQGRVDPGKDTSPWTLLDYKRALKNFYKWMEESEDPKIIDFMSVYIPESQKPKIDPDELLQVREVEMMINSALNVRDKALFALLWDTGARISELLNLDVGDISFEEELMGVNFRHGKNGSRKIYVVESIPLVRNWLKEHPDRVSKNSPLFTILRSSNSTSGVRRQSYRSAANQLNACAERAGISSRKRWNAHAWRRARATDMARKGMNQPSMCGFFGWVPGSQIPKYYIRLAQRDVERSIRDLYPGVSELEDQGPEYLGENIPEYSQANLKLYEDT